MPAAAGAVSAGAGPDAVAMADDGEWVRAWASSRNWTVEFANTQFARAFALVGDAFPYRSRPAGNGADVRYREQFRRLVASVAVARAEVQSTSKGKEPEHGPSALFDEQLVSALRGVVAALDADAGPVSATGTGPESGGAQLVTGAGGAVDDAVQVLATLVPGVRVRELPQLHQAVRSAAPAAEDAQEDTDNASLPGEADAVIRTLALEDLPRTLALWAHTAYSTLRPMPLSVDAAAVDALHQQRADHIRDIVTTAQHTAHTQATTPSRQDIHRETAHLVARTADQPRIPGQSGARTTLTPRDRHDLRTETVRHLRTLYGDTPPTTAIRTGPDIRTWDDLVTEDTTLHHWTTLSDTERHLPLTGQAWLLAPHYLTHPTPPRMHGGTKRIDDSTLYAAFKQYFAKPENRNTVPTQDTEEKVPTGRTQGADTTSGATASTTIVPIGWVAEKMRTRGRVLSDELYALLVANRWLMTIKKVNKKGETVWSLERHQDMQDRLHAAAYAAFYRANKGQQPRNGNAASKVWGLDVGNHLSHLAEGHRENMNEALINILRENNVSIEKRVYSDRLFADWKRSSDVALLPVTEEPPDWWPGNSSARPETVEDSEYSYVSGRGRVPALGPASSSRTVDPGSHMAGHHTQPAPLALGHEPALPQPDNNTSASANGPKRRKTNVPRALRAREIDVWFEDTKNHGKVPRSTRRFDSSKSGRVLRGFLGYWRHLRKRGQYADSLDDPILQALQAGGAPLDIQERPTEDKPDRVAF
uniref:hypothetical protein n=1 Tax=Streptomyces anthocyanicus TaxID=68174 RepID=UPI002F90A8B0